MTTLAVNKPRTYGVGRTNSLPVIASDIIYEGAAVGMVVSTGHARPLAAGDEFVGFAERKAEIARQLPQVDEVLQKALALWAA